jgi:hypothetical protein
MLTTFHTVFTLVYLQSPTSLYRKIDAKPTLGVCAPPSRAARHGGGAAAGLRLLRCTRRKRPHRRPGCADDPPLGACDPPSRAARAAAGRRRRRRGTRQRRGTRRPRLQRRPGCAADPQPTRPPARRPTRPPARRQTRPPARRPSRSRAAALWWPRRGARPDRRPGCAAAHRPEPRGRSGRGRRRLGTRLTRPHRRPGHRAAPSTRCWEPSPHRSEPHGWQRGGSVGARIKEKLSRRGGGAAAATGRAAASPPQLRGAGTSAAGHAADAAASPPRLRRFLPLSPRL